MPALQLTPCKSLSADLAASLLAVELSGPVAGLPAVLRELLNPS